MSGHYLSLYISPDFTHSGEKGFKHNITVSVRAVTLAAAQT